MAFNASVDGAYGQLGMGPCLFNVEALNKGCLSCLIYEGYLVEPSELRIHVSLCNDLFRLCNCIAEQSSPSVLLESC